MSESKMQYKYFGVEWIFKTRLMAGVPANPNLIRKWLEARKPSDSAFSKLVDPKSIDELETEAIGYLGNIPAEADASYLVFKRKNEGVLFVESYSVKAHLKDSCRVLNQGILKEPKQLRSKFADRVFIEPEHITITNGNGQELKGDAPIAGQWFEHPIHIWPRSAIKSNEFVENGKMAFTLKVVDDGLVDTDLLETLMEYGGDHGYGAERGLGYGKYTFSLKELTA